MDFGKEDFGKFLNWNNKYDELEYGMLVFIDEKKSLKKKILYTKKRVWMEWIKGTKEMGINWLDVFLNYTQK